MGYPLRPKNLKKSGFNDDNIAALRDLQRRVSALTEGQPNTDGVGALTWDEDRGTYNIAGTGETSFKIGEDLVYYAKNTSGSTIPIGSSVMFTGAVGASGLLTFALAVADGSVDPDYMMGITQQEIPDNGFGYVKHFGLLRGFRTDGVPQGETWSDGDLLYFDAATPGSLTKVKPVSPAVHEPIAVVVTASSGNSGSIFVRMKVSETLATLRDVYVNGSLTNGDVLIYDVTQNRFEANTLTAGANISITNGPGSITISSTTGTETDPIFTASPAFGITSGDISNWNTAYGWGNHALAGYLTSYTETDPTVPAHVKSITTGNISNWNTAYGWGDHSAAGYLTSFTETDPTVPSHVKSITTTKISNWNTAYGWGDHSAAGYLTSFSETDPTVPSHVKSITTTNISNWDTAYGWGNHAAAGYQAAATALTTSTTFGGDVSGTYNAIVVADDSHNHIIGNVDGLQTALDGKLNLTGGTMSGDLTISNAYYYKAKTSSGGNIRMLGINASNIAYVGAIDPGPVSTIFNASSTSASASFFTSGSEGMRLTNTGLGIGTSSPDYKLSVAGTSERVGIVDGSAAELWSNTDLGGFVFRTHYGLQERTGMYAVGNFATGGYQPDLLFKTNAVERLRITSAGRLGVNSNAPATIIHASDPTNVASSTTITRGSNHSGLTVTTPNNGDNMVGIFFATGTTTAGSHWSGITGNRSASASHWGTHLSFYTHGDDFSAIDNADERLRIDGSGNVIAYNNFRAPIFYDSNDTSYVLDPNGTSVLNAINVWGEIGPRRNDVQSLLRSYNTSAGGPLQFYLDHNYGNVSIGNNRGAMFGYGTYWEFANSARAPIFYDSNNTGNYLDPNGSSVLNVVYAQQYLWASDGNYGTVGATIYCDTVNSGYAGDPLELCYVRGSEVRIGPSGGNLPIKAATYYDYANTAYYVDPNSTSVLSTIRPELIQHSSGATAIELTNATYTMISDPEANRKLYIGDSGDPANYYDNGRHQFRGVGGSGTTGIQLSGHFEQGNNYAHPEIEWSGNAVTGMAIFYLPGTTANYGMVHMVFDIYEYVTGKTATVIIGGHNWNTPLWYNNGCQVVGWTDKSVRLGVKNGRYCVVFGGVGSTWSYATIRLRKIHNSSIYNNVMDLLGNWSTEFTNTESFTTVSGDLRQLRTSNTFIADGDVRSPIFYDSNDTAYYINPNGGSRTVSITTDNLTANNTILGKIEGLGITGYGAGELSYEQTPSNFQTWTGSWASHIIGNHGDGSTYYNQILIMPFWGPPQYMRKEGGTNVGPYQFLTNESAATGTFATSGDLRAPVFYDSNNTGYYADLSVTGDSIRAAGDIVAYYSDDRLKDRGDNIANALDKVQSLNGFHYTANETAQKFGYKANPQVGVSAQEVEAVLPEVVKDAAIGHGYKTVDYAKLVPLLIEAIKELKAEVETLKKG